jgi:hypothetical protein
MRRIRPLVLAAVVAGCAVLAGCNVSLFSSKHYYPEGMKNCPRKTGECPRPRCPMRSGGAPAMEGCPAAQDGAAE